MIARRGKSFSFFGRRSQVKIAFKTFGVDLFTIVSIRFTLTSLIHWYSVVYRNILKASLKGKL